MYEYEARLLEGSRHPVYDADTIKVGVDLGFGIYFNMGSCRLYGINAPEVRGDERERGIAARDYVRNILMPLDKFVIRSHKHAKGKYGRYLIEVILPDGRNLNEMLVENGYAIKKEY